ncbi:MAG TPA: substrate-binding domain-containing protein [Arsenicitalea sp.]|jgi:ribose transport system substrate-binding protein|nr:substrate-binding domain-containing protein [Arsenicitalea sp.]
MSSEAKQSMSITGLGPHGEKAVPGDQITLTATEAKQAHSRRFNVAVVLHTTSSDWSKQELAGIVTSLGRYSAAVVDVVDCGFDAVVQAEALDRLVKERPDAIISIPIGNIAVAEAHRRVTAAGIKLLLLDNAPTGLMPGSDYVSVISADNFGLGAIGAELLSGHIRPGGTAGILAYGADFYATHEREIAFRTWMGKQRPDVKLVRAKFPDVGQVGATMQALLVDNPGLAGLFAVWDVPAMHAVNALKSLGLALPMTTVDLGNEVAEELGAHGMIKGIAAQRPFDQGVAAGRAALIALTGGQPAPWIALPGLSVSDDNLIAAYQVVWHSPAPATLRGNRRG